MDAGTEYRFFESRGQGGFGTVYRARMVTASGLARTVAIKVLNPDKAADPRLTARLRDEARILGAIRHRAIVQVHALEQIGDRWAVVMEYVDGVDLKAVIRRGPVPASVAIEIAREVASALHAAWTHLDHDGTPLNLLHRDIKPSNLQITRLGEVKLLDFGIARAQLDDRESLTRGEVFGSHAYMAPERLYIVDAEDLHEGDVYALGAVLYEMLVGEPLGNASTARAKHEQKVAAADARLASAGVDPALRDVVGRALAFDARDRPDARALASELQQLSRTIEGQFLSAWADELVPALAREAPTQDGDLSGTTSGSLGGGWPSSAARSETPVPVSRADDARSAADEPTPNPEGSATAPTARRKSATLPPWVPWATAAMGVLVVGGLALLSSVAGVGAMMASWGDPLHAQPSTRGASGPSTTTTTVPRADAPASGATSTVEVDAPAVLVAPTVSDPAPRALAVPISRPTPKPTTVLPEPSTDRSAASSGQPGAPPSGVAVTVYGVTGARLGRFEGSDEHGRVVTLDGVPPGEYSLAVTFGRRRVWEIGLQDLTVDQTPVVIECSVPTRDAVEPLCVPWYSVE